MHLTAARRSARLKRRHPKRRRESRSAPARQGDAEPTHAPRARRATPPREHPPRAAAAPSNRYTHEPAGADSATPRHRCRSRRPTARSRSPRTPRPAKTERRGRRESPPTRLPPGPRGGRNTARLAQGRLAVDGAQADRAGLARETPERLQCLGDLGPRERRLAAPADGARRRSGRRTRAWPGAPRPSTARRPPARPARLRAAAARPAAPRGFVRGCGPRAARRCRRARTCAAAYARDVSVTAETSWAYRPGLLRSKIPFPLPARPVRSARWRGCAQRCRGSRTARRTRGGAGSPRSCSPRSSRTTPPLRVSGPSGRMRRSCRWPPPLGATVERRGRAHRRGRVSPRTDAPGADEALRRVLAALPEDDGSTRPTGRDPRAGV